MDEHQPRRGAGQAHFAEGERRRQQDGLERQEATEQQQTKEQLRTAEAPHRQYVAVQRTNGGRDQHRGNGDQERVPEVALHRRPGFDPADGGHFGRPAEQVAAADVFRRFEAGQQHDHQRHQINEHRNDQHRIDGDAAQAEGRLVDETSHCAWPSARNTDKARGWRELRRASKSHWRNPCPSGHG